MVTKSRPAAPGRAASLLISNLPVKGLKPMSDIGLIALLVILAAFIGGGLWITAALLVEESIREEIGR
jgi:hypothetical protein